MSSASISITRTYAHHGWRIVPGLGLGSVILLGAVSASAQTAGTSTSQTCTQDPAACAGSHARTSATRTAATRTAPLDVELLVPPLVVVLGDAPMSLH